MWLAAGGLATLGYGCGRTVLEEILWVLNKMAMLLHCLESTIQSKVTGVVQLVLADFGEYPRLCSRPHKR